MKNLNDLDELAMADAAAGLRVIEWGNGWWDSWAPGSKPLVCRWGETLAKRQVDRRAADLAAVAALEVGQSVVVVKGYHPRHGERTTTVTRVA